MPIQLNFKWTPCSIKSDFESYSENKPKVGANQNAIGPNMSVNLPTVYGTMHNQKDQGVTKNTVFLNHFEFHKELSRKDDLLSSLKT